MRMLLKLGILLLVMGLFSSCKDDCKPEKKNLIRELPLAHINDLEQINAMFLRNIVLLADSCCQNLGSALSGRACSDPDSVRRTYFYPATKHLLNKYLPESESATLKLIEQLSPNANYSNEDVVITNFSFRVDSTVQFPVFHAKCGDTITDHYIIFQKGNGSAGNFYSNDESITLVKQKHIKPDWTYYIIKYADN